MVRLIKASKKSEDCGRRKSIGGKVLIFFRYLIYKLKLNRTFIRKRFVMGKEMGKVMLIN